MSGAAPWLGASLPSFLVAFILHVVVGRALQRRPAAAAVRP
jgi:hypothetical protein